MDEMPAEGLTDSQSGRSVEAVNEVGWGMEKLSVCDAGDEPAGALKVRLDGVRVPPCDPATVTTTGMSKLPLAAFDDTLRLPEFRPGDRAAKLTPTPTELTAPVAVPEPPNST